MNGDRNVPTEEEFEKASAAIKNRSRGLSEVKTKILRRFQSNKQVFEYFILDSSDKSFVAYIFFEREAQIDRAKNSGLLTRIMNETFIALEKVGRGNRNEVQVKFEIDSNENVELNYEGDYYSRMR